jgi:hypothetical protein
LSFTKWLLSTFFFLLFFSNFCFSEKISPKGYSDSFDTATINLKKWEITSDGDFKEKNIDVIPGEKDGFKLRLKADTIATKDDTVKFLGTVFSEKVDLSNKTINIDIDWNEQKNGSYLTMGLFVATEKTIQNPRALQDWLCFQYVGVPPGKNGRFEISSKRNGNLEFLYTEVWPKIRKGRKLNKSRLTVVFKDQNIKVFENTILLFESKSHPQFFKEGYVYLQMSTHSNYSSREVYFDNFSRE